MRCTNTQKITSLLILSVLLIPSVIGATASYNNETPYQGSFIPGDNRFVGAGEASAISCSIIYGDRAYYPGLCAEFENSVTPLPASWIDTQEYSVDAVRPFDETLAYIANATEYYYGYAAWDIYADEVRSLLSERTKISWIYIQMLMIMFIELIKLVLWYAVFYFFIKAIFVTIPKLFIDFRDSLTVMFMKGKR